MLYYRYTAVGVFVLGRTFHEAWGAQARRLQSEFNDFLEVAYTIFDKMVNYFVTPNLFS